MADQRFMPATLLTFAEAERLGAELHDRWFAMTGEEPLRVDDMGWADIVQFVMRRATTIIAERKPTDEE